MQRITAITASKRDATRRVVQVDGRAVVTLSQRSIESLALVVGGDWDETLAAAAARAAALDEAFAFAMKQINRRALTRAQVAAKLATRRCEPVIIEETLTRLAAIGALDDQATARLLMDEIDRTRPAGPALKRAKLLARGVDEQLADEIVRESSDRDRQLADARKLIASKAKSMARLDETTRKRRCWGLLARRGFDQDTINAVLGEEA